MLKVRNRKIYPQNNNEISDFKFSSFTEINAFIELFKEANLLGAKSLDYADFCRAIKLMNEAESSPKSWRINQKFKNNF